MKLKLLLALMPAMPVIIFGSIIALMLTTLGGQEAAEPVRPPATTETAGKYAATASEMGVPWEIVIIADTYFAIQEGRTNIEDVNPIYTSLQFLILREDRYKWDIVGYETPDAESDTASNESKPAADESDGDDEEDGDGQGAPIYDWVLQSSADYAGKTAILSYVGMSERGIDDKSASEIVAAAHEKAASKSDGEIKFEVSISVNTDFKFVIVDLIGIEEEQAGKVVEIYESHYLAYLYFGNAFGFIGDYELPPVIVGNVSRDELARLASSIIGHPYYWGGKSTQTGAPAVPLDCSGFVDWVYYQCFGAAVNGVIPPGGIVLNGTATQFYSSAEISEEELIIGDLGFYYEPAQVKDYNHVGIYVGKINGQNAFLHCGGSSFGTPAQPSGRVGISINRLGTMNSFNPIDGTTFEPPMPGTNFKYFRRPNFQFIGDVPEAGGTE